jgi:hypothetical protein
MTNSHGRNLALMGNGLMMSYVILAKCLKNNGALHDGQLETALKQTIEADGADKDRLDYQVMAQALAALEGRRPPRLRVIPGGKSPEEP